MSSRPTFIFLLLFLVSWPSEYLSAAGKVPELNRLNKMVEAFFSIGQCGDAIKLAKRALQLTIEIYGTDHSEVGTKVSNLGLLYECQGHYAKAEPFLQRALKIREKTLGNKNINVGISLNNLAGNYQDQGRIAEAEALYKRAITVIENVMGPNHHLVGSVLNNLARLYHDQGRYIEAEFLLKKDIVIIEKSLGSDNIKITAPINNLALLYNDQSRYAEAERLLKRSLAIAEKILSPTDPGLATAINNLAFIYLSQKRFSEAISLLIRSRAIYETALGLDHPHVIAPINNLAEIYMTEGRYSEAAALLDRSLSISKAKSKDNRLDEALILIKIALLNKAQGRYTKAEPFLKRALIIREKALGSNHQKVGVVLRYLALIYKELGSYEDETKIKARLEKLPKPGTRLVPLYFVTNRKIDDEGTGFGAELSKEISLGRIFIQVPEEQVKNRAKRIGESLGQLEKAKTGKLTRVKALKLMRMHKIKSAKLFADSVNSTPARAIFFKNQALVFVHGYNNSFEDSMKRAAQLNFDLQFDGIMIPFSWPSQDKLTNYLKDGTMAKQSVNPLVSFLNQLVDALPGVKLHFLAHSMGNQVMLNALCKIAKRKNGKKHNFGQVISAHADVTPNEFEELTRCFKSHVDGITLYVNENDTALRVRCFGFHCRAGNKARGYTTVDTIDTTQMSKGVFRSLSKGFDHDVFVRNPLLFSDITRLLLTAQRPVQDRTQEFRIKKDDKSRTYWAYDKTYDPAAQSIVVSKE